LQNFLSGEVINAVLRENGMGSLGSSKDLAGIGAVLCFIPAVSIVGIIMVLIGMKGLAENYKDASIYRNALTGVIFGVMGLVALAVGFVAIFVGGMFSSLTLGAGGFLFGMLSGFLLLFIVFIFFVLMATYLRKAFTSLAQRSGEHLFETAGTWLFYGAILIIVFGIGLIIMVVAWIIATIAFFSIKVPIQPYAYAYAPTQSAPTMQASRFCPNCGAPVDANATFCPHCGKQLPP
jgi:uncharacterized membrane protein